MTLDESHETRGRFDGGEVGRKAMLLRDVVEGRMQDAPACVAVVGLDLADDEVAHGTPPPAGLEPAAEPARWGARRIARPTSAGKARGAWRRRISSGPASGRGPASVSSDTRDQAKPLRSLVRFQAWENP